MEDVLISVNIDPMFNFTSHVLKELNDQRRLEITNVQHAYLTDTIQSNDDDDGNKYKFGGKNASNVQTSASVFGRTASAIFRMVMLCAVQIEKKFWPEIGNKSNRRNKASLELEVLFSKDAVRPFKLLEIYRNPNKDIARMYWSAYDHAFPHFLIESKVLKNGKTTNFSNTMLIFRNKFKEVIEITTNAEARMNLPHDGTFPSKVDVLCIRGDIRSNEEDIKGGLFQKMKANAKRVKESHNYVIRDLFLKNKEGDYDLHEEVNKISLTEAVKDGCAPLACLHEESERKVSTKKRPSDKLRTK